MFGCAHSQFFVMIRGFSHSLTYKLAYDSSACEQQRACFCCWFERSHNMLSKQWSMFNHFPRLLASPPARPREMRARRFLQCLLTSLELE